MRKRQEGPGESLVWFSARIRVHGGKTQDLEPERSQTSGMRVTGEDCAVSRPESACLGGIWRDRFPPFQHDTDGVVFPRPGGGWRDQAVVRVLSCWLWRWVGSGQRRRTFVHQLAKVRARREPRFLQKRTE